MAIVLSYPNQTIKGVINLTASKSESNRALIIQALSNSTIEIKNLAAAKDTIVLQELLKSDNKVLNVGIAGTVMRFLTAYLSVQKGEYILTGEDRMKERPIKILVDALRELGANISYTEKEGYPPLKICGRVLNEYSIQVDGGVSSQYISALLMIAPKLKEGLVIHFKNEIISKPYIDMTIALMQHFGVSVKWERNSIVVETGEYQEAKYIIESDWSAASYWYGLAALAKDVDITLLGLKKYSLQGDAIVQEIYKNFGVVTEFIQNGIRLTKNKNYVYTNATPLQIDFKNCPDIAQTVAVTCVALNINAKFTGLKTLRIKETDRINALKVELTKIGALVEVISDELIIKKNSTNTLNLSNSSIVTYNDHRMAMAFSSLALTQKIKIEDEDVVEKSYPNYWSDLKSVGFIME